MKLSDTFIEPNKTMKDAMNNIDKTGLGIALVVENQKLLGVIADSDIRHRIMNGAKPELLVENAMNQSPITIPYNYKKSDIKWKMKDKFKEKLPIHGSLPVPVVTKDYEPIGIYFISRKGYEGSLKSKINSPAVKRILIVGGAGFLGSVLTKKLLKRNYIVRVFDNLTYGSAGLKNCGHENFEFFYGDMRNISDLTKAIKDVDAVVHLAAIVGDPASALNPSETIQANYLATKSLAELCKYAQINRFIFASTCSVYGASKGKKPLTEKSKLNPVSLYADMKLKSEEALLDLEDDNFKPTIFRMGTLYGASDRVRFDLVINTLTIRAVRDSKFTIFGGKQWRAFCHVSDAADQYIKCLETSLQNVGGEIFNIVSQNKRIIEIGRAVRLMTDAQMIVDESKTDNRNYIVDGNKFVSKTGAIYNKGITDGIREITILKDLDYRDKIYSNYASLKDE